MEYDSLLSYLPLHCSLSFLSFNAILRLDLELEADSDGCELYGVGLRPHACSDCEFESRLVHGCLSLSLVSVVCSQVEVSAMGLLLSRGVLPYVGCDLETSVMRRPRTARALETSTKLNL